jgi:hypothetical protein
VYSDNVQIIVPTEIYKVLVKICFVFDGRITPTPDIVFVRTVAERIVPPLFNAALDNDYDAQLQVEEERIGFSGILFL